MVTKVTEAQKAALLAAGGTQDDIDAAERGDVEFDFEALAADAAAATAPDFSRGITELADLINFQVGAWRDFGYDVPPSPDCKAVPPLGERSAAAITAGHEAVKAVDDLTRQLYRLREQLVTELRQDSDIRGARVDAMLAEHRGRLEAAAPGPQWTMAADGSHWRAGLPDGRTAVIRRKLGPDGEGSLLYVPAVHESAGDFAAGPECGSVAAAAAWADGQAAK